MQKAEIRVINQTICNQLLSGQLTPRMMCVGILTGGVDACQVGKRCDSTGSVLLAGVAQARPLAQHYFFWRVDSHSPT